MKKSNSPKDIEDFFKINWLEELSELDYEEKETPLFEFLSDIYAAALVKACADNANIADTVSYVVDSICRSIGVFLCQATNSEVVDIELDAEAKRAIIMNLFFYANKLLPKYFERALCLIEKQEKGGGDANN